MEPSRRPSNAVSIIVKESVLSEHPPSPPSSCNGSTVDSHTFAHPLLNPLIVDLVVKHLHPNFDQLKTLRLVSKVWTQATLNHWRKSCAVLTFVPDPPHFTANKYATGVTVPQFFEEFQDPQSPFQFSTKPFSKYKLKGFTLNWQVCSQPDSSAYKFWNALGPLIESIHFEECLFEKPTKNPYAACPLVQFLIQIIPHLKHLLLTDMLTAAKKAKRLWKDNDLSESEVLGTKLHSELRTLTIYGDLKGNYMSLSELLTLTPELEVIKGEDKLLRVLLKTIKEVRYDSGTTPPPLSNLKHLDLINSDGLYEGHYSWDRFNLGIPPEGVSVPLETLSFHVGAFDKHTKDLDIFLKSFSSTLKTFEGIRVASGLPFFKFLSNVSMVQLTEMYLWGTVATNFGFLRSTPNLKKLQINLGCFEKREEMGVLIKRLIRGRMYYGSWKYEKYKDDMVMTTPRKRGVGMLCTKLEYLEIDYEFPEKSLKILGRWMPNLKRLKTILNVGTISVVCEVWRGLIELVCLHGSRIENYCFIHTEKMVYFPWGPPEWKICHLKELERFQLDAYCDDCELTDDVVYQGFLKMPGLKSVQICVNSQMSVEAEEALRKGIQFCTVVRGDHDDCGGSPLLGGSSFLCDRCSFRREVIYGYGVPRNYEDDEDSEEDSDDFV